MMPAYNSRSFPPMNGYPAIPFLFQSPSEQTGRCGSKCTPVPGSNPLKTHCINQQPGQCGINGGPLPNPKGFCVCQHVLQQPWHPVVDKGIPGAWGSPGGYKEGQSGPGQYWFEIILINAADEGEQGTAHPIHHHGGWFNIIGMKQFDHKITREDIMKMDKNCTQGKQCLPRHFGSWVDKPVFKDTIQVPTNGYIIFRAPITNRGTWIFHCHINYH